MPRHIDYSDLPPHMVEGARGYIEEGRPIGGFLTAIFSNNLVQAFGKADSINLAVMFAWATFLYNEAPTGCWGNEAVVKAWQKTGGLRGYYAKETEE